MFRRAAQQVSIKYGATLRNIERAGAIHVIIDLDDFSIEVADYLEEMSASRAAKLMRLAWDTANGR